MIRDTSAQDRPLADKPHAGRRLLLVGAVLVTALGLAMGWPYAKRMLGASASVSAERLGFATVERGTFVRDVAGEAKVVAAVSPTLYAIHGGTVTLKVHAGDEVRKGQLLATIESPELMNKLAQEQSNADAMQADVLRAQVDLRKQRALLQSAAENARIDAQTAENDLARQEKAFAAGAVSGMQVEHAKDALEKARITLAHARSNLGLNNDSLGFDVKSRQLAHERQRLLVEDLKRQAEELGVRSPVDGQVGQLFVAERATIAKDQQLLSVVDLSALEVQMQVPESLARDLGIGMPGEISGNGGRWTGQVSAISPEVVGGQVAARLRFDGETPRQLRQNQRLSVRVLLDRREGVLTLARGGFVDHLGGRAAFVMEGDLAVRRPVRLGATSIAKVEVLDGLAEGDRVVVNGTESFKDADRVTVSR